MSVFKMAFIILSLLILKDEKSFAASLCSPETPCEKCYDLSSEEAMDIMTDQLSVLGDPPYKWEVDRIGYGLTCLDYCPPGDLRVAPGVFKDDKCTYRVYNNSDVDMTGECATIVLKRKIQ